MFTFYSLIKKKVGGEFETFLSKYSYSPNLNSF
jgi:hypothetical protein